MTTTPVETRRQPLEKVNPINPEHWETEAECFGMQTEWWFPIGPVSTKHGEAAAAIRACNRCPVIAICGRLVIESLKTDAPITHGIWAGVRLTETHSTMSPAEALDRQYTEIAIKAGCLDPYNEIKEQNRRK